TAGQRTLLIDCDLRRRALTRYFGFEGKPGLAEVLGKQRDVSDAIVHDERTGLAVLPAGTGAHSPADLLNSWEMRELIRELRGRGVILVAALAIAAAGWLLLDRARHSAEWVAAAEGLRGARETLPPARLEAGIRDLEALRQPGAAELGALAFLHYAAAENAI